MKVAQSYGTKEVTKRYHQKIRQKGIIKKEREREKWCLKIRTVDVYRNGRWECRVETSHLKHYVLVVQRHLESCLAKIELRDGGNFKRNL